MPAVPGRRRFAPDPRLFVGLALVIVSVLSVVGVVAAADSRTVVYAAAAPLSPGDRVDAGDLVERSVALDGATGLYLGEDELPDDGVVITESVREGELVPRSAVGSVGGLRVTSLVLESRTPVSGAVVPGSTVDIWAAPAADDQMRAGQFGPPAVLVPDAVVVRVIADDGLVATNGGVSVEVLVPRNRIARLLQAVANESAIAIVPAGLPLAG